MQLKWNLQANDIVAGVIEEFNNRDVYAHFLVIDSTAVSADVIFATFSQGSTPITSSVPLVRTMADRFQTLYGLPDVGESRFYCPIPSNVFVVGENDTEITITLTHKMARIQGGSTVYSLINSNTYGITVKGNNITADDKEALIDEELVEGNIYTTLITDYNYLVDRLTADEADIDALQTIVGDTPLHTTAQTLTGAVNELKAKDALIDQKDAEQDGRLTDLEAGQAIAESDISDLQSRMTVAEGDINTAESDISGLKGRMTTAEGEIDDLQTRTSELETQVGTADIQEVAPDITQAILSMNEDIDALQNGVVPRINRGLIDFADPTITPSAELVAALNAYILEQLGRTPDNTDKMTVRDDETPDEGTYYTYNYWQGYTQVTDGWYWDSISVTSPVNDVPSYSQNVLTASWGEPTNGQYTISIPSATHGQGTDNKLTVEFKAVNLDGTYSPVSLWNIAADGTVTLYTDTPFAGVVVIKAGTATYVTQLNIEESQVIGLVDDLAAINSDIAGLGGRTDKLEEQTAEDYYIRTVADFDSWQAGTNTAASNARRIFLCTDIIKRAVALNIVPKGNNCNLIGIPYDEASINGQAKITLYDGADVADSGRGLIGQDTGGFVWQSVENINLDATINQTTANIDLFGILANRVKNCTVKIAFASAITLANVIGVAYAQALGNANIQHSIENNYIQIPATNLTATSIAGIASYVSGGTVGNVFANRISVPTSGTAVGVLRGFRVAFNRVTGAVGYDTCQYGTCNNYSGAGTASSGCTKWSADTND